MARDCSTRPGQVSLHGKLAAESFVSGDVEVQQQPHHHGHGEEVRGEALRQAGRQAGVVKQI